VLVVVEHERAHAPGSGHPKHSAQRPNSSRSVVWPSAQQQAGSRSRSGCVGWLAWPVTRAF